MLDLSVPYCQFTLLDVYPQGLVENKTPEFLETKREGRQSLFFPPVWFSRRDMIKEAFAVLLLVLFMALEKMTSGKTDMSFDFIIAT